MSTVLCKDEHRIVQGEMDYSIGRRAGGLTHGWVVIFVFSGWRGRGAAWAGARAALAVALIAGGACGLRRFSAPNTRQPRRHPVDQSETG